MNMVVGQTDCLFFVICSSIPKADQNLWTKHPLHPRRFTNLTIEVSAANQWYIWYVSIILQYIKVDINQIKIFHTTFYTCETLYKRSFIFFFCWGGDALCNTRTRNRKDSMVTSHHPNPVSPRRPTSGVVSSWRCGGAKLRSLRRSTRYPWSADTDVVG